MHNKIIFYVFFLSIIVTERGNSGVHLNIKNSDLVKAKGWRWCLAKDAVASFESGVFSNQFSFKDDDENLKQILNRSFYSWDYFIMTADERIVWINRVYVYFMKILREAGVFIPDSICKSSNYKSFVKKLDHILFSIRSCVRKDQLPPGLWDKINALWNATFYFWLYDNDPRSKEPHNAYPNLGSNSVLHKKYLAMEAKVKQQRTDFPPRPPSNQEDQEAKPSRSRSFAPSIIAGTGSDVDLLYVHLNKVAKKAQKSVVCVEAVNYKKRTASLGSGVIVDSAGYIVTCFHVIQDCQYIKIILNNEGIRVATVVRTDPLHDLAVLKVDSPGLPAPLNLAYEWPAEGEPVVAIGNLYGGGLIQSVGSFMGKGRDAWFRRIVLTDAPIDHGNSGGVVINKDGEGIGIASSISVDKRGCPLGNAALIPISDVRKLLSH